MTTKRENKRSAKNEASSLLMAALAQLDAIRRAQAITHSCTLDAVAGCAREAIVNIESAMRSGYIDASTLASLAAGMNLGIDVGALAVEIPSIVPLGRLQLGIASVESHATVERFSDEFFDKHLFDADVERHTHGAEMEAFRKREAEDQRYIHDQLNRHTPEGDLNASGRMQGYMLDANAHGAGDNPEFIKDWSGLKTKTGNLRASMRAAGKSTDEYDQHIRDDVATFLKAKGLSDGQIKQALAKSDDPLDAVKPYLGGDNESRKLSDDISVENASAPKPIAPTLVTTQSAQKDELLTIDMDAMNAKLAATGLDLSVTDTGSSGHGLPTRNPTKTPDLNAR